MPEMTFTVRWPDGSVADCYSPSLVMHDHLLVGESYPLAEFVYRTNTALDLASERVRAKYGFECTSARQQQSEIAVVASRFAAAPDARVEVLAMVPPLGVNP
ncbi:MSMEG_0570 family nitrogen starvation response protein [Subtercola boreus]|uniref:MSMEG_0570 family nitrogen starvation response protein n=1 Tax=Subtercola boreus TaxID=120213 RepID=UPI000E2FDE05|nr:MSMEG_0570 family nitrogen starvation response protein [Subtercola boreus]